MYIDALYSLVVYPWWSLDHGILVLILMHFQTLGSLFIDPLGFLDHGILVLILMHFKTLGSLLLTLGCLWIKASLCICNAL